MARSKDHGKRWSHASHAHAERTHQRRVSTVGTDATTVALVATAFTRLKVQKVSMQDVTSVPLVGFSLNLGKHRVFLAKTAASMDKARGTTALATPGATSYLRDHSLTRRI